MADKASFRYSLRTLFVMVTACAIGAGVSQLMPRIASSPMRLPWFVFGAPSMFVLAVFPLDDLRLVSTKGAVTIVNCLLYPLYAALALPPRQGWRWQVFSVLLVAHVLCVLVATGYWLFWWWR